MDNDPRGSLAEHLDRIAAINAEYDGGDHASAVRLGPPLRAIFQGTPASPSLLARLGGRHADVLSTADKIPEAETFWPNLVNWTLRPHESIFACEPKLGTARTKRFVAPDFWWSGDVVYKHEHVKLHRSDLILDAAAKADPSAAPTAPSPGSARRQVLLDGGIWWTTLRQAGSPSRAIMLHHAGLAALRQVGYEVAHSPALAALAGR